MQNIIFLNVNMLIVQVRLFLAKTVLTFFTSDYKKTVFVFTLIPWAFIACRPMGLLSRCDISFSFLVNNITGYLTWIHPSKVPRHLAPKLPEPILLWKWLLPTIF